MGGGGPCGGPARDDDVFRDAGGNRILPLELTEVLGSVGCKDKPVADYKLTGEEGCKYSGAENGSAWGREVENHFTSVAPVLQEVLGWAVGAGLQLDLSKDISAGLNMSDGEDDPCLIDLHTGDSEYWTRQLA